MLRLGALVLFAGTSFLHAADNGLFFFLNGGNVDSYWAFDANPLANYLLPCGQGCSYLSWSNAWTIPGNYGTIHFSATAIHDISVGISVVDPWSVRDVKNEPKDDSKGDVKGSSDNFYSRLTSCENFYEIIIGGWDNQWSVIRRGTQTEPVYGGQGGIPLSPINDNIVNRQVEYKIIFYQDKKNQDAIAVYRLDPFPVNNTKWTKLFCYRDPSFITAKKRWFSFTSWDFPIVYTNISSSTSTTLPETK